MTCHHWLIEDLPSTFPRLEKEFGDSDFRLVCGHCNVAVAGRTSKFGSLPKKIIWFRSNAWFGKFIESKV